MATPLSEHFTIRICQLLKKCLNVDTVEDANRYSDDALLKIGGFGKIALHRLRKLKKAEIKQDLISKKLPSEHQFGDIVTLDLGVKHQIKARVTRVAFLKNSIQYDLDVEIWTGSGYFWDRIHGVGEAHVHKR